MNATDPPQPRRILLVRPSALGDVCRTVPVLASLRQAFPDAGIDWVVQDTFVDAVRAHPAVDEVIPFPRRRLAGWWRSPRVAREAVRWFADLRRRRYDVVYDLQGLGRSGLMAFASGAPRRVGFRSAREFAWLGYTARHAPPHAEHVVDQMLELLEREGLDTVRDMRLYAPDDAVAWWKGARRTQRLEENDAYAVLAPTSRWVSKRWPIERWAGLIRPLRERGFARVVVIGAPGERSQVAPLLAGEDSDSSPIIDLVGATDIAQTMAMIRDAGLVVANDSAPLHMAVGFDVPCVGLFGPTDPAFVGPYRRPESVVRTFDPQRDGPVNFRSNSAGDELMRRITRGMVVERVDAVLSRTPSAREADVPAMEAVARD